MPKTKMCTDHAKSITTLETLIPIMSKKIDKIYEVVYENGLKNAVDRNTKYRVRMSEPKIEKREGAWIRMSLPKKVTTVITVTVFILSYGALVFERIVDIFKAGLGI